MGAESNKSFSKWYETNKDGFNVRRKQKYHSDPEYREKVIQRQREARKKNPRPSTASDKHYRTINGDQVEVFRIGHVVEAISRSEKTIRTWESEGLIPAPSIEGKHRYYTQEQVSLLKEFSELMEQVRYDKALREFAIQKKSGEIHEKWSA